jgi:hypothetical protein
MRQSPRVAVATIVLAASLLVGCATMKPMGFSEPIAGLPQSRDAVAFFSVRTANQNKTGFQPKMSHVFVWEDGKDKREKYSFQVEDPYRQGKDEFNEYLISLRLPAGRYMLRELFGTAGVFPIRGTFGAPVFIPFELSPGSIVYLGRIEATIRTRRSDDELRAGPLVPLIDQAVTGLSGGTFEIRISDNYEGDVQAFGEKYPALAGLTMERAVLPAWSPPTEERMK